MLKQIDIILEFIVLKLFTKSPPAAQNTKYSVLFFHSGQNFHFPKRHQVFGLVNHNYDAKLRVKNAARTKYIFIFSEDDRLKQTNF